MNELGWKFLTGTDKRAILKGIEDGTAHGGPYHLEIHPTDRCNLDCFFCSTRLLRQGHELEFSAIRQLVAEMRDAGTRSVCISGGGEPLVHPKLLDIFELLEQSRIHIGTLTTNGISLHREVAKGLLDAGCDQLRVSLNCSNGADYARMMQTRDATFHRVLDNVRDLLAQRAHRGLKRPEVIVQFLPYKENFRSIPEMYELASRLGVDGIVFNGLSYLQQDLRMQAEESREMFELFEQVLRVDEYRRIRGIYSLEQDVSQRLVDVERRLGAERNQLSVFKRLVGLARRRDFSTGEKWRHHWRMRRRSQVQKMFQTGDDPCIMPWYTMTVRADGTVPICCVLQGSLAYEIARSGVVIA